MAERRVREAEEPDKEPEKELPPPANDTQPARNGASSPASLAARAHALGGPGITNGALGKEGNGAPVKETKEEVAADAHRVPLVPAPAARGPWRSYKEIVAQLAGRIVEAQRPIRVLQALRWDDTVEEHFLKTKQRELPRVDAAYYEKVDLGFDARAKVAGVRTIARDIERELGEGDAIGQDHDEDRARVPRRRPDARRRAGRRRSTSGRASSTARPRTSSPTGARPCATSVSCSTACSRTSTSGRRRLAPHAGLGVAGPRYARNLDATEAARQLGERLALFFGDTRVSVRGRRRHPRRRRRGERLREGAQRREVQPARHRHPRGARGLGARRHVAQRTGAARGQVAREGAAAHDGRAGGARGAARDVHVPHVSAARAPPQRPRPRRRQGRRRRELPRRLRVVPDRGLRRRRVLPQHAPRLPRRRPRAAARRSPRTPATARASCSTTRSSAARSSTTGSTSCRSSSSARSRTRTSPCSRGASRTGS